MNENPFGPPKATTSRNLGGRPPLGDVPIRKLDPEKKREYTRERGKNRRERARAKKIEVEAETEGMDNDTLIESNSQRSEKLTKRLLDQYEELLKNKRYVADSKNGAAINRMQTFIQKNTRQYRASAAKAPPHD